MCNHKCVALRVHGIEIYNKRKPLKLKNKVLRQEQKKPRADAARKKNKCQTVRAAPRERTAEGAQKVGPTQPTESPTNQLDLFELISLDVSSLLRGLVPFVAVTALGGRPAMAGINRRLVHRYKRPACGRVVR